MLRKQQTCMKCYPISKTHYWTITLWKRIARLTPKPNRTSTKKDKKTVQRTEVRGQDGVLR